MEFTQACRKDTLLYTATNIRQPDEIWFEPGRRGGQDKLYYFSRFEVSRRGLLSFIAVFGREQGAEGYWLGRAGWPWVITHPRLPQIRTCPIRASGSSA